MEAAAAALGIDFSNDSSLSNDSSSLFTPELLPCGQIPIPEVSKSTSYVASLSLLLQLVMLATAFMVGHLLRRFKILIIHEAGAALGLGVLVGLLVNFLQHAAEFRDWIKFNNNFFFYFLLPPIIFIFCHFTESGWSCETKKFFGNFGAICTFAFGGTFISAMFVGAFLFLVGKLHWAPELPFLVCLTFGALISATDPVTVLAVFHQLGVDGNLYSYVFGESVLNDAVAIVMYRTVLSFVITSIDGRGIEQAVGFFIVNFLGSFAIGVLAGLISALTLKHGGFEDDSLAMLQSGLLALFPYMAYFLADAMELSGIVAILFAGITMKYYTAPHLSPKALDITSNFFSMLAKLSELFVFIYMGVAVFLEQQDWRDFTFTLFTIVSILIGRFLNIYPLSLLINLFRNPEAKIPLKHQHALWFGGLRGAMAFALALQSIQDLPNDYGRLFLTSTLMTVTFTVLAMGGTTTYFLQWLGVDFHVNSHPSGEDLDREKEEGEKIATESRESVELSIQSSPLLKARFQQIAKDASFTNLDKKFLTPIFANPTRRHTVELPPPEEKQVVKLKPPSNEVKFERLETDENDPGAGEWQSAQLVADNGPLERQSSGNVVPTLLMRQGSSLSRRATGFHP